MQRGQSIGVAAKDDAFVADAAGSPACVGGVWDSPAQPGVPPMGDRPGPQTRRAVQS